LEKDTRETCEFLKAQQIAARQEVVAPAKDFLRHAIPAAEIAAIGDRKPQVAKRALAGIKHDEDVAGLTKDTNWEKNPPLPCATIGRD
jgi:hypothetical protein